MSTSTSHSDSGATARAVAFVAARRDDAEKLGTDLAEHAGDPDAFAAALRDAFGRLADPEYLEGERHVAPGIAELIGVRWPLHAAVARGFRRATRDDRASVLLFLADRLFREPALELRWFAFGLLERTVVDDPERSWQLLRRAAREAGDWITVDTLAHPYGRGILREPYRWAELEQLAFSPNRWERRLVGSTIATIPHVDRAAGRAGDIVDRSLALLEQLVGDPEPEVQKALAWAYRTMAGLDAGATAAALEREADRARATGDGNRAWVIRDALAKLDDETADRLRASLGGLRRDRNAPSTAPAAQAAARFGDLDLGRPLPEPPLA
jgi:3-methyladenine DNA glycosylase AlkD